MARTIQVWEGEDDDYSIIQNLVEQTVHEINGLLKDLADSARWFPSGERTITHRLVFVDRLVKWVRGMTPWKEAEIAYRDLQEVCSLYTAAQRESMAQRILAVLNAIKNLRDIRG